MAEYISDLLETKQIETKKEVNPRLQPFVANLTENSFALAHNGNLTNSLDLRRDLELQGAIFSSTSDTEVFLHLIARQGQSASFVDKLSAALVRGPATIARAPIRTPWRISASSPLRTMQSLTVTSRHDPM